MDNKLVVERVVRQVQEFAAGRANDVARGAETPRLAALLVQKYGRGMADAIATAFDSPRAADSINQVLDEETAKIDPLWREHDRERWAANSVDVVAAKPLKPLGYISTAALDSLLAGDKCSAAVLPQAEGEWKHPIYGGSTAGGASAGIQASDIVMSRRRARKEGTTDLDAIRNGAQFTWGTAIHLHEVGPYSILEFHPWKRDGVSIVTGDPDTSKTQFHSWVDGKNTSHSYASLDAALAGCIAHRYEGSMHQADYYFMKMLVTDKSEK